MEEATLFSIFSRIDTIQGHPDLGLANRKRYSFQLIYGGVYINMSDLSRETYIDIFDISEEIYRQIIFS